MLIVALSLQAAVVWVHLVIALVGAGGRKAGRWWGRGSPQGGGCGPACCALDNSESWPPPSLWSPNGVGLPKVLGLRVTRSCNRENEMGPNKGYCAFHCFISLLWPHLSSQNACAALGHLMCPKDLRWLLALLSTSPCTPSPQALPSRFTGDDCVTTLHGQPQWHYPTGASSAPLYSSRVVSYTGVGRRRIKSTGGSPTLPWTQL